MTDPRNARMAQHWEAMSDEDERLLFIWRLRRLGRAAALLAAGAALGALAMWGLG